MCYLWQAKFNLYKNSRTPQFWLTLSWQRQLSYRNQSIDLQHDGGCYHIETSPLICKSMDWFLYDNGLHHERVNWKWIKSLINFYWLETNLCQNCIWNSQNLLLALVDYLLNTVKGFENLKTGNLKHLYRNELQKERFQIKY